MTMSDKEDEEPVKKMQEDHADNAIRAVMAACIANEMRAGRSREEATQICYAMMRKRLEPRLQSQPQSRDTASAKAGKLSTNPKELPTLTKRGICIYILEVDIISRILKDLFTLLEKGTFIFKKKLSPDKSNKIMKEVASYIYFETVKQIWEYQEGDLPEQDARRLLDVISNYFYYSYHIDNLADKLEEYRRAKNPVEYVSRNIQKIVEHRNVKEQFLIAVKVGGIVANPEFNLFDCIREMFKLSDAEMAETIEDFFLNVYPRLIKQ